MRTFFRISVTPKGTGLSVKMISTMVWISTFVGICLSNSEADTSALRRSSFSTSTQFINPYKSRGASLQVRQLSNNANQLQDAAPFPFRHLPSRPVSDSFFYDPQVSPTPVHLRRQRQQFQNTAHEQDPILSAPFVNTPNDNPIVQIRELPPRNLKQQNFHNTAAEPFIRRAHPLIAASMKDATIVKLQEISELPQTSPFPSPPPTSKPQSISPEGRMNIRPSNDEVPTVTTMSFAKFSQSGQNLFDHRTHPTSTANRKQVHKHVPPENILSGVFIPASQRPEMPTTRSRITKTREKHFPVAEASPTKINISPEIITEIPQVFLSSTSAFAFPTIMLKTGLGVRVTEKPPSFDEQFSEPVSRNRGSTPDTIAKLRQQHRQVKLTASFPAVPLTASFPAVPESTPLPVTNKEREPRVFLADTTTAKTTTSEQKSSTSFSTPTTSLFAHLRERPVSKHTLAPPSGTTRSTSTHPRSAQLKGRQSLLRAITDRLRSTTPLPPIEDEVTLSVKEFSKKPEDEITLTETSTQTTVTIPFREPRILSKFRQKAGDDDLHISIKSTTIKHRTLSPFKKSDRLTTARIRESTIAPTSSFRNRGGITAKIIRKEAIDPCLPSNHKVIQNQPNRSFNRHLSQVTLSDPSARPICDQLLEPGWYRFDSPAGNLMPTECPGGKYCGTNMPIWMKGDIPDVSDGIVSATGCINNGRECCVAELPIQVRNCSHSQGVDGNGDGIVVYHLGPTPECNMGYCAGEGLPCPNGLSSRTGFTPCNFPVELKAVTISTSVSYSLSKSHDVVMLHCNPIIEGIVDPSTITVDVKWWISSNNKENHEIIEQHKDVSKKKTIFEETFRLSAKTFSTLNRHYWTIGDTVRCSALVRHDVLGSSTNELKSPGFFLGIKVVTPSQELTVKEGGPPAQIKITSTVPITCIGSSSSSNNGCCIAVQIVLKNNEAKHVQVKSIASNQTSLKKCTKQTRPTFGNTVARTKDGGCMTSICSNNWNQTQGIEIISPSSINQRNFQNSIALYSVPVDFKILQDAKRPAASLNEWTIQRFPPQNIKVLGDGNSRVDNNADSFCELASPTNSIRTFDGLKYNIAFAGTYTLFRHKTLPYEVQANLRSCNIRNMCICSLIVRSRDTAVTFDVCTKGYMRAWAKNLVSSSSKAENDNNIQEEFLGLKGKKNSNGVTQHNVTDDIEVFSIDDGRFYQLKVGNKLTPSSSLEVTIGPLLTYVKITASLGNMYNTLGLCGTFDSNIRNEFIAMKTSGKGKRADTSSTSRTTQVIEHICNDDSKNSNRKNPCSAFFNAWSLQPSMNLFSGHINETSIHSEATFQIKRPPLPEGFCYCENEHLGKNKCQGDSAQMIKIEDIREDGCFPDSDIRGVDVLSNLLSFGKNRDYDPNAMLVSKLDEEESNDATLRLLQASLNHKSMGSPGRIGELASTSENVINNDNGNGIDSRLTFPDINVGDSGSSIRIPSKGASRNSAISLCEDILRNSGSSFNLCQKFIDVDRYVQDCRLDLLFSGNAGTASLHLKHLKEDCLDNISERNDQNIVKQEQIGFGSSKLSNLDVRTGRGVSLFPVPETTTSTLVTASKIADSLCLHDCSGNGNCDSGMCTCHDGFFGSDCSVEIRAGEDGSPSRTTIPRTSSLGNYGLCNVRAKPCRDVVVLGDGFVNHPGLTCIYETYKIRGVASKQIVKDTVETTAKAKFIAHGQVMCPLPEFEIHRAGISIDSVITNLKDNTDHSRLFVKLSLAYIPKTKNQRNDDSNVQNSRPTISKNAYSAPLDLLLYDSLCWDCESSGKCIIRPKSPNKASSLCFFASANSLVEVFRIGKTISTKILTNDDKTCTLPKDGGGCDNKIFRYYYNAIEKRCKIFIYGGCKGNRNNFLSETQCLQRCDSDYALAKIEIDTCSQKRDAGICPGNVPRFYFDKKLGRCQLFTYGGCGGNSNNFASLNGCVANCGGPSKQAGFGVGRPQGGKIRPRNAICSLTIGRGTCKAKLRRFHFDVRSGTCKLFIFGGCQGNANNFETMEECITNCFGLESSEMHNFGDEQQDSRENQNSLSNLPPSHLGTDHISVCKLPKDFGTCLTLSIRFYHDTEFGACKKFRYSGCGGNGNNFLSGEACVRTCGGLLHQGVGLPKLPRIDLAPNPPTGNGGRNNVVSSLPALQSTPNFGSGVSIVAITPRTPRSTTTTSTTTIGIASTNRPISTERPIFNVNTILPNVIDDSREIKEENRSQQIINRKQHSNTGRVRQRKVRVRQRKRPKQESSEQTETEKNTENTPVTTTRNLSSRLGKWNSKDTRSRLRQVAEKRLRANAATANALKSKFTTSDTSKGTTLKSTTIVQSRGEEGLIGEGSEPEHTQIRTQTSRSIVMRQFRRKQQKEDFKRSQAHNNTQTLKGDFEVEIAPTSPAALRRTAELFETFSSRRPSRRVISVLGNITRATPSGVTRFPAGHRLSIKSTNFTKNIMNSIKEEEDLIKKNETPQTTISSVANNQNPCLKSNVKCLKPNSPSLISTRTRQFSPSFRHISRIKTPSLLSLSSKKVSTSSRQSSHILASSKKPASNSTSHSISSSSDKNSLPQTTTPKTNLRGHTVTRKKSRQKIRGGRVGEVGVTSSVTSVSEEAAVIGPSGRRISQVDQVVTAPERFNGSSALVVIRSFCRFAPLESDSPHCRKSTPLYFYNVTSAACEPFYGGHCQRSRNRFRNVPDCLKSCVVSARGFTTAPLDVSDRSVFTSRGRGSLRGSETSTSRSSEPLSSPIDNSRISTFNLNRQRVRGLIRNFTGPNKNKPKPATVTEN